MIWRLRPVRQAASPAATAFPLTAIAMVLTVGGPMPARLTCVAAVGFATASGVAAAYLLDRYVMNRGRKVADSH